MRILLGYQNSLCRAFIRDHLAREEPSLQILVAGTLRECLQLAAESSHLDAVALDLDMIDMDGLAGYQQMRDQLPETVPVALIGPKGTNSEMRDYLSRGIAGYLPYSLSTEALLAALRILAAGENYMPVDVVDETRIETTRRSPGWLTGREKDVLTGLLNGQSNKEIARDHGLSEVTIKHHLKSLRSKLGARNRTHAVCRAIELGIAEDGHLAL